MEKASTALLLGVQTCGDAQRQQRVTTIAMKGKNVLWHGDRKGGRESRETLYENCGGAAREEK